MLDHFAFTPSVMLMSLRRISKQTFLSSSVWAGVYGLLRITGGGAGDVVEWSDGEGGWGGTAGDGGTDAEVDQWRGEREDKVFGAINAADIARSVCHGFCLNPETLVKSDVKHHPFTVLARATA